MKEQEIIKVFEDLAKSQGFYAKLLGALNFIKVNDYNAYKNTISYLEELNFKSSIDLVLFIESN